jgi:hypothetical protein
MHHWPIYLAALPASLLRLIAATHRISLPRRASPGERLERVRSALCRPVAVRECYFALPPDVQAAAQSLRSAPRTLSAAQVAKRFGPLRPLAELRRDRRPCSTAELLLLHGWLLPRPPSRNHPPRYVIPPELRAWLPVPLSSGAGEATTSRADSGAPPCPSTPALRAVTAMLVAAAHAPLPLRCDSRPTVASLRRIRPLLAPLPETIADQLVLWVAPLMADLGLLAPHGAAAVPAPAAATFLARPACERLQMLCEAWERAPRAEPALLPPRASSRGVDWPALRRRLVRWVEALPPGQDLDAPAGFALLAAAFGPFADAYTHPFRVSSRPPWNRRTELEVWCRALSGPLAWLGLSPGQRSQGEEGASRTALEAPGWSYGEGSLLEIPHAAVGPGLLATAPFASEVAGDEEGVSLRLAPNSLARAAGQGHDSARLRAAIEREAGPLPPHLAECIAPAGTVRLLQRTVVIEEQPGALDGALRTRSVRRLVEDVVAPGIALAAPGSEAALARRLAAHGHVLAPLPPMPQPAPVADLSPAEAAALVVASAHYRTTASPEAPAGPDAALIARLRAALPPALRAATDAAVEEMERPANPRAERQQEAPFPPRHSALPGAPGQQSEGTLDEPVGVDAGAVCPPAPPRQTEAELLATLRVAMRRRETLALIYQGADDPAPQARTIRPLRVERHGDRWYLHAYCLLVRAERCFRLDRAVALAPAEITPAETGPRRRAFGTSGRRRGPTVGFFAPPPTPPAGSPLVRVWLDEGLDQPVGRLGGDTTDAEDSDTLDGVGVETVAAHAVGVAVDQLAQLPSQLRQLGLAQLALEDAVLDSRAVPLQELHHPGTAFVGDDIVADDREHVTLPG